jgi:hypothetical protein
METRQFKTIRMGNISVVQYPPVETPEFILNNDGDLFIHGYSFNLAGWLINGAKRCQTGLKGYTVIGKYDYAIERIKGDLTELVSLIDKENCVFLVKTSSLMKDDDYI